MESGSVFFQSDPRHVWTIIRFGTTTRFFPLRAPPKMLNFPPTFQLTDAFPLVAAECFFESRKMSKSFPGGALNFTVC